MFTGIIEDLGRVVSLQPQQAGARLRLTCSTSILHDLTLGASVSVNGACLSASQIEADGFFADLAPETLRRTNLGSLQPGSLVNLERPLRATGRLDGHFVLGHVDATATILSLNALGSDNWWLEIEVPPDLSRYIVSKGSLSVDGISLTVANVDGTRVAFTIIPLTYENTTLRQYKAGDHVNIEVDILAKHMEKLVGAHKETPTAA